MSDPQICHGKPVIKGTRVMIWQILELLEAGETAKKIYQEFPTLLKGSIKATLHFAAERAKRERYVSFTDKDQAHLFTPDFRKLVSRLEFS